MTQDSTNGRWSVLGGTVLSILPCISSQEILKTVILATVGALVSYVVTRVLKRYFK